MPPRRRKSPDPAPPSWLIGLAWGSVGLAVVVCFGLWPLAGGDLWMHLTVGKWIWTHGWVPLTDPFSYVTAGQPFIAHSWLAEVVFYLIEQQAGTIGFMLLRFALISVALLGVLQTARFLKAPWPALLLLAPIVLTVMWGRLEFRPQLFTTAFLACELWLLISVHTGQRSWRWLWLLPPLYTMWINLHGNWVSGLLMLEAVLGAWGLSMMNGIGALFRSLEAVVEVIHGRHSSLRGLRTRGTTQRTDGGASVRRSAAGCQ
jgi:hypothetical protein